MPRYTWQSLDLVVRAELEERVDRVLQTAPLPISGTNSDVLELLHLATGRRAVLKGVYSPAELPTTSAATRLEIESAVLQAIPDTLTPQHVNRIDRDGWLLLVLDQVRGKKADLSPGSSHVGMVSRTLATLAARQQLRNAAVRAMPTLAHAFLAQRSWRRLRAMRPTELHGWVHQHLDYWADIEPDMCRAVEGFTVQHTALRPADLLVSHRDVTVLDWSHAHLAPRWIDLATFAVLLTEHGHTISDAVNVVSHAADWPTDHTYPLAAHAVLTYGLWELRKLSGIPGDSPAISTAAHAWLLWAHHWWSLHQARRPA